MSRRSSGSTDSPESTAIRLSAHCLSRSSSSSDTSHLNITSDVDPRDNFYNSEWRAGGPYLCSLPAYTMPIDRHWYKHHTQLMNDRVTLCRAISGLLETQGMHHATVEILTRKSKVDPEHHGLPTVLILARRSEQPVGQDWRAISRVVYAWMSKQFPGFNVEVLDEDEAQNPRCYPVVTTDSIYPKWEHISHAILQNLDVREWTSLQCYRYGIHREPSRNPVTILVTVYYSAEGRFESSQDKIQAILASFGETTTAIVFLQDEFKNLTDFARPAELDDAAISEKALPGVSLGIRNSSAGSSTFGGYIELLFPGQPWKQYGLTCFHCVYPPPGHREALLRRDGDGKPAPPVQGTLYITEYDTKAREILHVEQPSAYDLRANIDRLSRDIDSHESNQLKDLRRRIDLVDQGSDEFYVTDTERRSYRRQMRILDALQRSKALLQAFASPERYYLGHVVFGSGLHRTKRCRDDVLPSIRDWALIQVAPKRLGKNNVYTYGRPFPPEELEIVTSRDPEEFQNVLKCGRSTQMTKGKYGGLRPIQIAKGKGLNGEEVIIETREHSVVPYSGLFAEPGDSGSLVFNPDGIVVGMLVAGATRIDAVFFQHILDVFEDIKDVTGAVDVRLM